jgi:hypothetical protein
LVLTLQKTWLGPLLRLRWWAEGDSEAETVARGSLWLEQGTLLYLRARLLPAARPGTTGAAPEDACWLWTGPLDATGTPIAYNQGQQWTVPRLLYTIQHGPLSPRMQLRSRCGVLRCCKPDHQRLDPRGPIPRPAVPPQTVPVCASGHPQIRENQYVYRGKTYCRACHAEAQRRYRTRGGGTSSASRSLGFDPRGRGATGG